MCECVCVFVSAHVRMHVCMHACAYGRRLSSCLHIGLNWCEVQSTGQTWQGPAGGLWLEQGSQMSFCVPAIFFEYVFVRAKNDTHRRITSQTSDLGDTIDAD